ncbi:TPA: hypothetical protein SMI33_000166 [Serratia marcescens]|nr:hypothetical protein [Serratia marcescens]
MSVLRSNRGLNFEQQLGLDEFDTEEEVFEENQKYGLHLINRGYTYYLGIDDVANEENACEMAFSAYMESQSE